MTHTQARRRNTRQPSTPVLAVLALTLAAVGAAGCSRTKSDANPPVASAAAPDKPAGEAATKYTCSMDPDVMSDKPGKCPKCGMNLVPVGEH